jgi:RNA polymerase sigma factor (sigma-70 family)
MSRTRDLLSVSALTDEQLGRRALDGDRAAFTELFGRHEAGLLNVAHRLTGSREDAADIAQEAFLRVFARLDDLAGREVNLAAYLHRTARNLVYDRGARRGREAPDAEIERAAGADEAMEADPELTSLVAAVGEDVRAANARLPERHRLVLALRELEDMSYEDIGRVLDVTPGAVAQLLSRARMALRRERLQQVDPERMDPACRARLGDIGALIDGELNPDRAQVLVRHLEACDACRAARAAFEEARVTYRAWPPLLARAAAGRRPSAWGSSRCCSWAACRRWSPPAPAPGGRRARGRRPARSSRPPAPRRRLRARLGRPRSPAGRRPPLRRPPRSRRPARNRVPARRRLARPARRRRRPSRGPSRRPRSLSSASRTSRLGPPPSRRHRPPPRGRRGPTSRRRRGPTSRRPGPTSRRRPGRTVSRGRPTRCRPARRRPPAPTRCRRPTRSRRPASRWLTSPSCGPNERSRCARAPAACTS